MPRTCTICHHPSYFAIKGGSLVQKEMPSRLRTGHIYTLLRLSPDGSFSLSEGRHQSMMDLHPSFFRAIVRKIG